MLELLAAATLSFVRPVVVGAPVLLVALSVASVASVRPAFAPAALSFAPAVAPGSSAELVAAPVDAFSVVLSRLFLALVVAFLSTAVAAAELQLVPAAFDAVAHAFVARFVVFAIVGLAVVEVFGRPVLALFAVAKLQEPRTRFPPMAQLYWQVCASAAAMALLLPAAGTFGVSLWQAVSGYSLAAMGPPLVPGSELGLEKLCSGCADFVVQQPGASLVLSAMGCSWRRYCAAVEWKVGCVELEYFEPAIASAERGMRSLRQQPRLVIARALRRSLLRDVIDRRSVHCPE